ncbi:alpha/beta hydrolase [Rhodococcus phenolicus]|uniref:alpha/beta hydrolase n=1 Tax=Rhodococcus phenolicus TaxID=263849 RepID=UPI00082D4A9C|nr:alpha/beta hydrolase family protein [Rhodococcus phenolicus]
MRSTLRSRTAVAALALLCLAGPTAVATADPAPSGAGSPDSTSTGAYVDRIDRVTDRKVTAHVYSPSMGRTIPLDILLPADTTTPRPVLYLLNGAGGGEDSATWQQRTDAESFFADKDVYVITPIGGAFSYYTDWQQDDPVLGRNKWTTFLTRELPPVVDATFATTGANAIAGLSSSATSVLNLAIARPGLYRAVGSYSGCASTSDDLGRAYVTTVVESRGNGDVENMWGPADDPDWVANDAIVNAEKLRGTDLYVSSATGLPGQHERLDQAQVDGNVEVLANQILVGGVIEAATDECTHRFVNRLGELDIPVQAVFRPVGTHSWGYWQDDLHQSWPMIEAALNR